MISSPDITIHQAKAILDDGSPVVFRYTIPENCVTLLLWNFKLKPID
jgi:hypothetical protein